MNFKAAFATIAIVMSSSAAAETLNNEAVLTLLNAGLGDDVVIAKIKSSPSNFELSTDTVIALKQRGGVGAGFGRDDHGLRRDHANGNVH